MPSYLCVGCCTYGTEAKYELGMEYKKLLEDEISKFSMKIKDESPFLDNKFFAPTPRIRMEYPYRLKYCGSADIIKIYKTAVKFLKAAAYKGHVDANGHLGDLYLLGDSFLEHRGAESHLTIIPQPNKALSYAANYGLHFLSLASSKRDWAKNLLEKDQEKSKNVEQVYIKHKRSLPTLAGQKEIEKRLYEQNERERIRRVDERARLIQEHPEIPILEKIAEEQRHQTKAIQSLQFIHTIH